MDGNHNHGQKLDPIIIGLVGILFGAIMVATIHFIAIGCRCLRRQSSRQHHAENNTITIRSTVIDAVPVSRYSKDCSEEICSVCLCEFGDGEQIRVLPECLHLFHVACIDTWLNSHSNCPLCRANTVPPQNHDHVVEVMPDSGEIPSRERDQDSH